MDLTSAIFGEVLSWMTRFFFPYLFIFYLSGSLVSILEIMGIVFLIIIIIPWHKKFPGLEIF